ncbi:BQ2448_5967 [Microbotryum intermedium]|uniref:BQ2448_5967 protein n=1 Tax=Microbotryum intermedium TaxID=269621 RepID=A0A238F5S7_9BASI|nr:BQ2448_5967 [Microbotryum intermedium]
MADFIGSHISLISKSDIKYLGVLHSIDPVEATVSLEKVRSLGTEGRKGNPAEEIPPNDNVYDFVVFRAADVKDLQIEAPPAATPSQVPISDPAVVAVS